MKTRKSIRIVAALLCAFTLISALPLSVFAAWKDDNVILDGDKFGTNGYYNVISKKDYVLVPGAAVESDIVLNNATGTRRQEVHVMEIDLSNPDVSVLPGYYGIDKYDPQDKSTWHSMPLSQTIDYYEKTFGYNIVGGMNTNLCYENDSVQGFLVFNRQVISTPETDSHGDNPYYVAFYENEDGSVYCECRNPGEPLTGEELHAVSTSTFGFYVKDGQLCRTTAEDRTGISHPRSVVGIKEDGTLVMMMVNGRMVSSSGLTDYEIGEFMLSLGCKWALNCDGGGSSTFITKRQGETELTMRSIPSDGAERPTIQSLLIASNVAPTGEFGSAEIKSDYEAFAPYSSYTFTAAALDTHGYAMDMPEGITWSLSDGTFGTIENGAFVSNGKLGEVDVQVSYNGDVVGSYTITVMHPFLSAINPNLVVPYGKSTGIGLQSLMTALEGEEKKVYITADAFDFTVAPAEAGHMDGFNFVAAAETAVTSVTLTAAYKYVDNTEIKFTVTLGKGSEILWDFEDASQLDDFTTSAIGWKTKDTPKISLATAENGKVHDGQSSLRFEIDATHMGQPVTQSMRFQVMPKERVVIEGAKSVGAWVYIPNELWTPRVRFILRELNEDGSLSGAKLHYTMQDATVWYNHIEESGNEGKWFYFKADIDPSKKYVLGNYSDLADNLAFLDFQWHTKVPNNNINTMFNAGTVSGVYNIYIDSIQVDYSDAVADRETPTITNMVYLGENETTTELTKNLLHTTQCEMLEVFSSNLLNLRATIKEDTSKSNYTGLDYTSAKILVDGVETPAKAVGEYLTLTNYAVSNGVHRITFVVADKQGNETRKTRWIRVVAEENTFGSTITMVPDNPDLDKLYNGSLYWVNLHAGRIETIKSVTVVIDKNSVNHWELDHMWVADGFTAKYSVDLYEETATITITRTGENTQTEDATLAKLPIRIIDWADIYNDYLINEGLGTPEDFKAGRADDNDFAWPHDLKLEILRGEIEFVDGYTSNVANTFSSEYFRVNTIWYSHPDNIYAADPNYEWLHIHTLINKPDVGATHTTAGYTGRTYCEVCKSVVDWGKTTYPEGWFKNTYYFVNGEKVTGQYVIGDMMYIFDEDGIYQPDEFYTGFYNDGNGWMYFMGNYKAKGFVVIGENTHYFDQVTGYAPIGSFTLAGDRVYRVEGEQGKVLGGWDTFVVNGVERRRYYYSLRYYKNQWLEIDGESYYFNNDGYALIGKRAVAHLGEYIGAYEFDSDGKMICAINGPFIDSESGSMYFAENGVMACNKLVKYGDDYYFARKNYLLITWATTLTEEQTGGLLPAGEYKFGADGKLQMLNGPVKDAHNDAYLNFYKNGVRVYEEGLYEYGGNYYYVRSNGLLLTWGTYIDADKTNGLLPAGEYKFGADGKLQMLNGPVADAYNDAYLNFYKNGVRVYEEGLYEYEGNYYYVRSNGLLLTWGTYIDADKTNGLLPAGEYKFGADGKLQMLNGPVADAYNDAYLNFYKNGVRVYEEGLYEYEGNYYYVRSNGLLLTWGTYIDADKTNGLLPAGEYKFGTDGKLQMLNGPVADALNPAYINFYKDGVRVYEEGLYEYNGDYYYVRSNGLLITWGTYVSEEHANGLVEAGEYQFGEDGKMIK